MVALQAPVKQKHRATKKWWVSNQADIATRDLDLVMGSGAKINGALLRKGFVLPM